MKAKWHVDIVGTYKVGDPCPSGYNDFHEWAKVQIKGGLKQRQCPCCKLWLFPQEFKGHKKPAHKPETKESEL